MLFGWDKSFVHSGAMFFPVLGSRVNSIAQAFFFRTVIVWMFISCSGDMCCSEMFSEEEICNNTFPNKHMHISFISRADCCYWAYYCICLPCLVFFAVFPPSWHISSQFLSFFVSLCTLYLSVTGWVFLKVLQHVHHRDSMCGLVLPGVPPALHSSPQQAGLPARATQYHRCLGNPSLLCFSGGDRGGPLNGTWSARRKQGLPGQTWPGVKDYAGAADPVRDATGSPLSWPADTGTDGPPQHPGVWPSSALSLCGRHSLLPLGPFGWKWTHWDPRLQQHPCLLLVGHHFHDNCRLWWHGATIHSGTGCSTQQHP